MPEHSLPLCRTRISHRPEEEKTEEDEKKTIQFNEHNK